MACRIISKKLSISENKIYTILDYLGQKIFKNFETREKFKGKGFKGVVKN